MRNFSDMGFRIRSPKENLLFLLGLFSTWQIVQVAGFSLSTWFTMLTAGYLLLTHGFDFRKDWLLLTMLASAGITLTVSMVSDIPADYKKASLLGTVQWGLIFVICAYMRRENTDISTSAFFRGFDWSCKVQVAWCILQIGAYYVLGMDINTKLFGELLRTGTETSQFRNGVLACTGLHWHASNLIPVLVYLYFRHHSILYKLLCIVVVYFTKNATSIVAIGLCVGLELIRFCKRTIFDRNKTIPYRLAVYIMLATLGVAIISPIIFPKVREMGEYLLLRLYQIANPTQGNESSTVHFNYYRHLPYILRNISPLEVLSGSGFSTSGYRFTQFFAQYPEGTWIVESDPVNLILSQGLIGVMLHYFFVAYTTRRLLHAKQSNTAMFFTVLFICGFIYNNQLLWVQLLEFMLYCRTFQAPTATSPCITENDKESS